MLYDDKMIKNIYTITEENEVYLDFHPSSQEKDIKTGSHYADLYGKGVVTVNEAREKMGKKALAKDQEKDMFHKRTEKKDEGSKLSGNVAKPKNQHTKSSLDMKIPKSLVSNETRNYALSKISTVVDRLEYGIDDEGLIKISERVLDRLMSNITLSQEETIKEEVTNYILE